MAGYWYDLQAPTYTPNRLLNVVAERIRAQTDSHMAYKLGVDPSTLTRVRQRENQFGPRLLLRIIDVTKMSFDELKELGGMQDEHMLDKSPWRDPKKIKGEEHVDVQ